MVLTIAARREARLTALQGGVAALRERLAAAAPPLRGRFLLYGSAARGELRHDSDVDLLLDFPDEATTRRAWELAEAACRDLGLRADIRPLEGCGGRFLAHVMPEAVPIP
jgi:predicted nucleotidyltransferase